jgi:endonuclease/exonuclease/phosphatase family metal-dependent hydrolase
MGDFNFKPTDSMYELYTKGTLDKDHPDNPAQYELCDLNYYESNTDLSVSCVKSAYVEAHGSEPPYTNNAQVRDNPRFVECLDYIFMSKDWTVKFASKIEKLEDEKPFPDEKNPSDHVPISITCQL